MYNTLKRYSHYTIIVTRYH